MLDTIGGSSARPAVDVSKSSLVFRTAFLAGENRRSLDRRAGCRRAYDRRVNFSASLPPGIVERRKTDRRLFDRRLGDRRTENALLPVLDRDALYKEFQPLVRRLIRQYGDCPEVRQDLAGEIYFRFCYLLEAFDPARGVPLRPYLVRQLSASIYTYARHGWIRQRREISYEGTASFCENATRIDPTQEWDDRLAAQQIMGSLPDAIANLPRRQRQVVVWRYYEQLSFDEIAGFLGVKASTARSLLRHGINGLRRQIRR